MLTRLDYTPTAAFAQMHTAGSVVLPKPAGAETSVSLRVTPSFSRSVRRGRETKLALSPACPERSRRVRAGTGDVEFGSQQWHGHFAFPGGISRPTSSFKGILAIWSDSDGSEPILDCLLTHRLVNLRTSAEPLTPLKPLRPLRPLQCDQWPSVFQ
jgi:hypothetical protein